MTATKGKELLLATLRHEPVDTVPWVPFAGVHAGKLKGYSAEEVLKDADKLFAALMEVNRVYDPDGQPVLFDLQIEAEILGCELVWAEESPPSVASHPLADDPTPPGRLPTATDGRLPLVLDVMRRMKAAVGDRTALYGLICGPLTLASHLRGTELFMDIMLNPDAVTALMAYTTAVCKRMTALYVEAGMDVIAVVDPMVSQIGPHHFTQFLDGPFSDLFAHIRQQGALSSFFVCGDATKNIEVMCQTGPDSISVDENIQMPAAKAITDRHNITLGGNVPLTTVMLLGSQADNMKWVIDWLDKLQPPNLILAPGCDMPYDTPIENTIGLMEAIRHPATARQMLADYSAPDTFNIPVELPDYAHLERPLVEVFTLDSDSCAACSYMFSAARRAVSELGTPIDIAEYKFTKRENVARCMKMGVKNLPSIYINGELKYSSIIPSNDELLDELRKAAGRV
ncbi:MAG TPA: uroporphyrinogen decarboxylase family protein [Candidatus Limnocylindrales bacterium]|nr:uroporphyrinogen decarboxylase family protein [Candidatus Limnocylindrales bacterium]